MTIKLTAASFLAGVRQSGLIAVDKLDPLLADLQRTGVDTLDSAAIAKALVERMVITEWQADKLLQGRHKGFILGRYKLMSLLGAGEMSAVYLAEHMLMERRCAIKVLPANRVQDTSYLGRFHREAKAVAALNHPNIVRAYDVDQQDEGGTIIHFLVMEFVAGKNLDKLVKESGPLNYVSAVDIVRQAADGLAHAHQAGMVHRDVKPENLLIDDQGVVKLLDLGLARFFKSTDEESLTIKHDEKVLGTADFLAPEQAIDSHKVDARADVYSLGCTLYYALTGHPPFNDGTLVQRLLAHQTRQPPSVRVDRPDVPDSLLAVLQKMMEKRVEDRYQSATAVSEALSRWLIANAPATWKQKHLMIVASLCGVDAIQGDANPQPKSPSARPGTSRSGTDAATAADRSATARPAPLKPRTASTRLKSKRKLDRRDPLPGTNPPPVGGAPASTAIGVPAPAPVALQASAVAHSPAPAHSVSTVNTVPAASLGTAVLTRDIGAATVVAHRPAMTASQAARAAMLAAAANERTAEVQPTRELAPRLVPHPPSAPLTPPAPDSGEFVVTAPAGDEQVQPTNYLQHFLHAPGRDMDRWRTIVLCAVAVVLITFVSFGVWALVNRDHGDLLQGRRTGTTLRTDAANPTP